MIAWALVLVALITLVTLIALVILAASVVIGTLIARQLTGPVLSLCIVFAVLCGLIYLREGSPGLASFLDSGGSIPTCSLPGQFLMLPDSYPMNLRTARSLVALG